MPLGIVNNGNKDNQENKDSFDDYMNNYLSERQKFEVPLNENENSDDEHFDEVDVTEIKNKQILFEASALPAEVVVNTIDIAASGLLAWLSKSDESFTTDDDTKETYIKAWQNYLKDKGADFSPGLMLLIMTIGIYGPKIPFALQLRKEKKKNAELEQIISKQAFEINQLKNKKKSE
jgi:hypothetical protein